MSSTRESFTRHAARGALTRAHDTTSVETPAPAGAASPAETYPAIKQALIALGDHHSFLESPASSSLAPAGVPGIGPSITGHPVDSLDGELLGGHVGFAHVPKLQSPPIHLVQRATH